MENVYKDIYFSMNEIEEIITSTLVDKTGVNWYIKNRFTYVDGQKNARIDYFVIQKLCSSIIKSYLISKKKMYIFEEINKDKHVDYKIKKATYFDYKQKESEDELFDTLINNGSIIYLGSKEVPISTKSNFYNLLSDYSSEYNYLDTDKGFFQFPSKYDNDLNLKLINFAERKKYQKTHK